MKPGSIVKTSFFVSFFLIVIAAYLKFQHVQGSGDFLIFGIFSSAIFIASAIYEVRASIQIGNSEKTLWTVGLLLFSGITGFIYILFGRRRIANDFRA